MGTHALERTSPKGEGQKFIGTCFKCGRTGLAESAVFEECDNPSGMTEEQALLTAIAGPEKEA